MRRAAAILAIAAAAAPAQTPAREAPPAAPHKAASAGRLPSYGELRYPELRPIVSPAMESVTLPNGMRLFLLENHELPLVNGMVLVRTGVVFDPPGKIGLASLTAQGILEGGTTNRPGDDLTLQFQTLGAELDGSVSENSLSLSFSALKENAPAVLDALKAGLTAPEFPQDRLDLAKTRLRNSIAHRNDSGAAILRREFVTAVYGANSPYGARLEHADVDRINRADLVAFHQRYFFPANVMLSLEGDFDAGAMKSRIAALFDDWKSAQPAVPDFPKVGDGSAPGRFLAVKKDVTQAYFAVGQMGGEYLDKDRAALEIMVDILGGGSGGRLNQRLADGVESLKAAWDPAFGHSGTFQVSGVILNPFHTTRVLQAVYEELHKIRAAEVSEEELKTAKAAALNSLVFAYDNQLSILRRLTQYQYFHFPGDYTQQYQKALQSVTRADVLRVARERLDDPAKMTTVVVANPTAFEAPLETLGGTVTPIDLAVPLSKPEAALGDPASQRLGKELLARAQQAMGGADKLAGVTDYVQELDYQFDASAGGTHADMTERWIAPGHFRQDSAFSSGKVSVYCDGKTGWVANARTSSALAGVQLEQMQGDIFRVFFPLLVSDRWPNRKVNALDDHTVEISDGAAGQVVRVVIDPATGLLESMLYEAPTANGAAPVIERYSDYRDVGGVKFAFKVAVTLGGRKFQELTVKSLQLNTGLRVQDLEKRP
jgi:zinc protease